MQGKYKLSFPSWVRAGNIADNAVYICAQWAALRDAAPSFYELRPEIGLCFFESAPCLNYGRNDLPIRLSGLPCTWHLHLPLDLPLCALSAPTPQDISESFNICLKLLKKCDFLEITSFVLHPPSELPGSREAADDLEQFVELWVKSGLKPEQILFENQPGDNLSFLLATADRLGSGLCFDFAHCHMGRPAAEADICDYAAQSELWHLNAPGPALNGHAPLTALSISQKKALSGLLSKSGQRTYTHSSHVLMLELFEWSKIEQSMPVLEECISASVLY